MVSESIRRFPGKRSDGESAVDIHPCPYQLVVLHGVAVQCQLPVSCISVANVKPDERVTVLLHNGAPCTAAVGDEDVGAFLRVAPEFGAERDRGVGGDRQVVDVAADLTRDERENREVR